MLISNRNRLLYMIFILLEYLDFFFVNNYIYVYILLIGFYNLDLCRFGVWSG